MRRSSVAIRLIPLSAQLILMRLWRLSGISNVSRTSGSFAASFASWEVSGRPIQSAALAGGLMGCGLAGTLIFLVMVKCLLEFVNKLANLSRSVALRFHL